MRALPSCHSLREFGNWNRSTGGRLRLLDFDIGGTTQRVDLNDVSKRAVACVANGEEEIRRWGLNDTDLRGLADQDELAAADADHDLLAFVRMNAVIDIGVDRARAAVRIAREKCRLCEILLAFSQPFVKLRAARRMKSRPMTQALQDRTVEFGAPRVRCDQDALVGERHEAVVPSGRADPLIVALGKRRRVRFARLENGVERDELLAVELAKEFHVGRLAIGAQDANDICIAAQLKDQFKVVARAAGEVRSDGIDVRIFAAHICAIGDDALAQKARRGDVDAAEIEKADVWLRGIFRQLHKVSENGFSLCFAGKQAVLREVLHSNMHRHVSHVSNVRYMIPSHRGWSIADKALKLRCLHDG